MIQGTTKDGFKFSIPEGLMRDFFFIKAYKDMQSTDGNIALNAVFDFVSLLFDDEDEERRFYEFYKDLNKGKRISFDTLFTACKEIIAIAEKEDDVTKK